MAALHDLFDLATWTARFDLDRVRLERTKAVLKEYRAGRAGYDSEAMLKAHLRNSEPIGEQVVGPAELAIIEQLRHERGLDQWPSIPVDVFVWALGEAPDRAMTSVGQAPYWPASRPWPRDSAGKPLLAVGQLSFVDSTDVVAPIPGEILVFFVAAEGNEPNWSEPVAHWISRADGPPIENEPPVGVLPTRPVYGVRHRTRDFTLPDTNGRVDRITKSIATIEGTKVGGLPHWIQRPPRALGRFLGSLGSVIPQLSEPYPFLNVPIGSELPERPGDDLSWGDAGSVYAFEAHGETKTLVQYY